MLFYCFDVCPSRKRRTMDMPTLFWHIGHIPDEQKVWVGNVPAGYCDADVRAELQRHNVPCPFAIKVCQSYRDNQFAFLYYGSRSLANRALTMGQSAIVWEKTKKYGFFKVFFFTDSFPVLCFTCL